MNLLTLLILRPKILKFFAVVLLYLAIGSCLLAFLAWIVRTLGI
jgi:hypothetical protein